MTFYRSAGGNTEQCEASTLAGITNWKLAEILCVPEIASTLAVQAWLHSTVDGGLCSLHCCLGENPEDLHCHLDTLVLVPPQVRLHHPRVQREHAHPCTCSTYTCTYTVTYTHTAYSC